MPGTQLIKGYLPLNVLFQGTAGRDAGKGATPFNDVDLLNEKLGPIPTNTRITHLTANHGWLVDGIAVSYGQQWGEKTETLQHGGTGGNQTSVEVNRFITKLKVYWGDYNAGASHGIYIARVVFVGMGGEILLDTGEPQGFGALDAYEFDAPADHHIAFLTGAAHAPDNYMCGLGVGYVPIPE